MSKNPVPTGLIIDWSPRQIVAFDVTTHQVRAYTDPLGMPYAGRSAVLAISRRSVFVRATRVPNAAPEEIRTIVQLKLAELFPVPPADLAFDFALLGDLNEEGRLALIVAMPVTELRKALDQMESAGIKVTRVVPLALGSAFLAEALGYRDAAVVEKNDDYASIDLVVDGVLRYSRVAPPGTPIEVEISRTYNASGLPCSAIIAGGGTQVGEADATTRTTALEALGDAWSDRLKLNLRLPEAIAARELAERRQRQRIAFIMFLAGAAALAYAYSERKDAVDAVDAAQQKLVKQYTSAKSSTDKQMKDAKKQQVIAKALTTAFNPAQRLSQLAAVAANKAPVNVWLTGLSVERGKEITLRGTATNEDSVAAYVSALNLDTVLDQTSGDLVNRFRSVKLVFANNSQIEKQPVVEFSITAFPQGNLPITLTAQPGGTSSGS